MKFKKRDAPKSEGGGKFLKFEDGDSQVVVLKGEVYEYYQVWEGSTSRIAKADEKGAKSRFRINAVLWDGERFVAKIFEFGLGVYNDLADLAEEYDLDTTKIKITRKGTRLDTEWKILPILKEPLTPKQLAAIEAVNLLPLEVDQPERQGDMPHGDDDAEDGGGIPF